MADGTCMKVIINDQTWNIRSFLKPNLKVQQIYISSINPTEVFIKFYDESNAHRARKTLLTQKQVVSIEAMDQWPFEKKPRNRTSEQNNRSQTSTPLEGVSDTSFECSLRSDLYPFPMVCNRCRKPNAELVCSVCAAWYCSEQCQLIDWSNHRVNCIPRLVRGFPVLNSLHYMAVRNMQQNKGSGSVSNEVERSYQRKQSTPTPKENKQQQQQQQQPLVGVQQTSKETLYDKYKRQNASGKQDKEKGKKQIPGKLVANEKSLENEGQRIESPITSNQAEPKTPRVTEKPQLKQAPLEKAAKNVGEEPQLDSVKQGPSLNESMQVWEVREQSLKKFTDVNQEQKPTMPKATESPKELGAYSMLMKRMQLKMAAAKRSLAYSPFPAVGSTVTISFVSEKELYIHEFIGAQDGQPDPYLSYIKRSMEHAGEIKRYLQNPPAKGDIVFAPFDDNYYRAEVRQIDGNNVTVFYPDFGNSQSVRWNLVKEIQDTNVQYANCLTHAALIGSGSPFSPAVHTFLNDLVEEEVFKVTRVEDVANSRVKVVELRHVNEEYLLGEKICAIAANELSTVSQTSELAKSTKATKLVVPDPATYKPVSAGEFVDRDFTKEKTDAELTIIEASNLPLQNLLSAIHVSENAAFATMLKECEEYGAMDPNQYLLNEPNKACLVLYDGTWTRAFTLEGGQYYLIEFGLIREMNKSTQIRRFPPALSRKLYCDEYEVDNPDVLFEELKANGNNIDMLRGKTLKAQVYMDSEDSLHMTIKELIAN